MRINNIFYKKTLSVILINTLICNILGVFFISETVSAADSDGSAHLAMTLAPSLSSSGVVAGRNFTYSASITNTNASEGDAFKYGYILQLPTNVSFVSSDLGAPDSTVNHASGSTLLFFRTNLPLLKGLSKTNNFTLTTTSGAVGTTKNIQILGYANDNIYGVGKPPVGSPPSTLTGGVDFANSSYFTGTTAFPGNIGSTYNLSTLPFTGAIVGIVPFDISKSESSAGLVGDEVTTTLSITNNNLGALKNINIQDVIPTNRKFVSFTSTGGVGSITTTYDSPSAGKTKLDFNNINVATGATLNISYKTLLLSHNLVSATGDVFSTGSFTNNGNSSINLATPHTGSLASGALASYWNNGVSDILVNGSTLPGAKNYDTPIHFANIGKSVDKGTASIGETLTYTLDVDVSQEFNLLSTGDNTYIDDVIPDGMTFSGAISSTIVTGSGTVFDLSGAVVDANGITTVRWNLPSGVIVAGSKARIMYQTWIDGAFEGTGPVRYINNDTLTNTATLTYKVGGSYSGTWGSTEGTLVDTIYTDSASASTRAPTPVMNKQLVKIIVPGGATYDNSNPLGSNKITVGSKLTFAISADFPNVYFTGILLKDALPLLAGPNSNVYDIAFQTDNTLKDMSGINVDINDTDGNGTADTSFNGQSLSGTTSTGNTSWLTISDPNYINFDLGSGNGGNKFSILFTVDILPTAPETIEPNGLHPLLNVATGEYRNAGGTLFSDLLKEVPFTIAIPKLNIAKTASGGTNVAYGKQVDYTVTISNSGAAAAFAENIVDSIPADMTLDVGTWTIKSQTGLTLSNANISQSGTGLSIDFNTGSLGSSRSLIGAGDSAIVKYTLRPTSSFVIKGGDTRTNTVSLDYFATPDVPSQEVNNYGPISASANFTVAAPTIARTLVSSTETDSATNNLYIGEEATFDTTISFPGGKYLTGYFLDTADSQLQYLSGEILSYSGNLSFNTGATFSTGGRIDFGDVVNDDNNPASNETITLRTTYRVKTTATALTNRVTTGTFYYTTTNVAATSNVNYRLPTTTIVKSVNPTLADASDTLTYSIKVTNTSATAHGYNYALTDIMPSGINYIPGSLTGNVVFSGTESDFFTGSGITIDKLNPSASGTITYTAIVGTGVIAAQVKNNIVNMSLSTLPADGSPYEKTYTGTSNVNMTIKDVSIVHALTATDLGDTGANKFNTGYIDAAIGEELTYRINVTLAELDYTGTTITQTLPTGLKFTSGSIIGDDVMSHSLSTVTLSGNTQIIFNFGDIGNLGGTGTGFILETKASLIDTGAVSAGQTKNSSVTVRYNGSGIKTDATPNFDVVEPALAITKSYTPNTGDGGDTIATTITVTNGGSAPAYDVTISDVTPAKTTTGAGFYSSTGVAVINPGNSVTYSYNTILDNSVTYGELLTGTASVVYTSYPGNPTNGERSYNTSDTDTISVTGLSGLTKTLTTSNTAKIADKSTYRIAFPISEGATSSVVVIDNVSTGMVVVPGSVNLTTSAGVTYSGTVTPSYNTSSDTIGAGAAQKLTYTFTNIVNSDSNNAVTEYIYIDYDAVVVNSTDNNSGDSKTSPVSADYNAGTTILNASPLPVTIAEPNITLSLNKVYTDGHNAEILYTITNIGNTGAYDVSLNTLLSSGLSYSGSLILTNSGLAVNLEKSGNNFTIDYLPVNTGNPLTFKVPAMISNAIGDAQTLSVTGNLVYTSQNGAYSAPTLNSLDTERNGTQSPTLNDYFATGATSFLTKYAILNEYISVSKPVGVIGDVFTYTVTLVNSGSVNLTNINVNLDISDSFTGFTVTSIPGGSSDNSNATGGVNNQEQLSISGIALPIGSTTTITYQVNTKTTVEGGTVVNTIANVSDTPEGAIGGAPSVPVTINAPKFTVAAEEVDDNGGSLYQNEGITHNITLNNIGTSTGTNVAVTLTYSTGFTFNTGSLAFMTGSKIDTGSIVINDTTRTITFTLISMKSGSGETLKFKTIATGPVGSINKTTVTLVSEEGPGANGVSNELIIVAKPSSGGGGGGAPSKDTCKDGDYSGSYYDYKCGTPPVVDPKKLTTPEDPKKLTTPTPVVVPSENPDMKKDYDELQNIKKRIQELENKSKMKAESETGFKLPSILPKTGTPLLERTKIQKNAAVETLIPEWVKNPENPNSRDLNYWLEKLPFLEDKDAGTYIVLPNQGIISPVVDIPSTDANRKKLISGHEIDVNKYLKNGMINYPGTSVNGFGEEGNMVIFGHSSYFKKDNGRYKTVFQKIIELDVNESILIYKKDIFGEYKLYEYNVTASYNTKPTDVKVLLPNGGSELTLFTCTPIGNLTGRWIVKAKYIGETTKNKELEELKKSVTFDITDSQKQKLDRFVEAKKSNPLYLQKVYIVLKQKMSLLKVGSRTYEQVRYLNTRILETLFGG